MNHTVIMGRKTYESLGKPLQGRDNVVLSRNAGSALLADRQTHPNLHTVRNRGEAILLAGRLEADRKHQPPNTSTAFIIGGAQIYEEFLPLATSMSLTEIGGEHHGDTFFPEFDCNIWRELTRNPPMNGDPLEFVLYGRVFAEDANFGRVSAWAEENPRHAWALHRVGNAEVHEEMISTIMGTRTLPPKQMSYLWELAGRLEEKERNKP